MKIRFPSRQTCQLFGFVVGMALLMLGLVGVNRLGAVVFSAVLARSQAAMVAAGDRPEEANPPVAGQVPKEDYFVEYRMDRERTRGQQIELLREIVNNNQSPPETRKEAQKKLLELSDLMKKELEAEKIIVASGYKDAIIQIQPGTVSVVVPGPPLSREEKARLAELVARALGVKAAVVEVMTKG